MGKPIKFIKFLKDNACYEDYCKYLEKFHNITINDLKDNNETNIYGAFPWVHTEKGFVFWDNLNKKWQKEVENEQ